MSLALSPGLIVKKRFLLDRLLGQGGMSCVWAATNIATARPVALKFLKRPASLLSRRRRRFLQEARVTIDHPNVVEIYDCMDLTDEIPFLVMEILNGETLAENLRRTGRLPVQEACALLSPVISAVRCAHTHGIVHRDLKPENLFLARALDGTTTVKVLDFGVAKLVRAGRGAWEAPVATERGARIGTVGYVAPEQACGGDVSPRVDTWALGVLLYECLLGRRPFPSNDWGDYLAASTRGKFQPLRRLAPETPVALADLVHRMLSPDPLRRPHLRLVSVIVSAYAEAQSLTVREPTSPPAAGEPLVDTTDEESAHLSDETETWAPDEQTVEKNDGLSLEPSASLPPPSERGSLARFDLEVSSSSVSQSSSGPRSASARGTALTESCRTARFGP